MKQYADMINKGLFIVSIAGLALLASCGERGSDSHAADVHESGVHDEDAGDKDKHAHGNEIELSVAQARSAGVVAEVVKEGDFHSVVRASGSIQSAPGDESTVVATMSGVVRLARALTAGLRVSSGTTLFRITSDRIQDGDPAERAYVAYEAARREYERVKALVADKIVTEKEFNAVKENYEMARIAYKAVAQGAGGKGVSITAGRDGYVTECLVSDGDYVAVGQPLLTVARNRRLSLVADVPARYAGTLGGLKSAKFRSSYGGPLYNVEELGGKLLAYGNRPQTASSFVPVTFEFDRADGLMAGMSVEVWLIGGSRQGVLTLPLSALTEEQGTKFVYIKKSAEHYEKREVTTGDTDGERIEIKSGVKPGETVVTKGAIHVKLASASNAIPAHTHSH